MSVSREEFDALRQQVEQLQSLVLSLQAKLSPLPPPPPPPPPAKKQQNGTIMSEVQQQQKQLHIQVQQQQQQELSKYSDYKVDDGVYSRTLTPPLTPVHIPIPLICRTSSLFKQSNYLVTSDLQAFEELKSARDQIFSLESGRQDWKNIPETAWLERFLHAGAQEDITLRNELLLAFSKDFIRQASTRARIILQEMNIPTHKKSILPLKVGGIAGGTKYLDHNILFKFADDPKISAGKHLYGGQDPDPERAAKAAANDLKGADAYFRCFTLFGRIPIVVPPQVLLDFNGFRLIAMPWLPLANATLVYGSSDGGRTVHDDDDVLRAAMKFSAHHMHLALHAVNDQYLYAAGDIEAHKDADGRFYLIDLSRTFPPEDPSCSHTHLTQASSAIFFRMHRAEFLDYLKSKQDVSKFPPLSPDAFSIWGKKGAEIHNKNAHLASDHLIRVRIPELVAFMQSSEHLPGNLGQVLQQWGISVRHLGLVRACIRQQQQPQQREREAHMWDNSGNTIRNSSRSSSGSVNAHSSTTNATNSHNNDKNSLERRLLVCMVERCCKNLLRQDLREAALSKNVYDAIAAFLNAVTRHSTEESISFWAVKLPKDLLSRFGPLALTEDEEQNLSTLCKPSLVSILRYVCAQTGISLANGWSQPGLGSDFSFSRASILSTSVRSKMFSVLEELLHEDTIITACESKNSTEFTVSLTKLARKATGDLAFLIDSVDDLEKVEKIFQTHSELHGQQTIINKKSVHLCVLASLALFFGGKGEMVVNKITNHLKDHWCVNLVPRLPQIFSSSLQIEQIMTSRLCNLCQREMLPSNANELAVALVKAKADPNARLSDTKDPLLLECVLQGHESLVETLLECKADCGSTGGGCVDGYGKSLEQILNSYFFVPHTTQFRIRESLIAKGLVSASSASAPPIAQPVTTSSTSFSISFPSTPSASLASVRLRVHALLVASPGRTEGSANTGGGALLFRVKLPGGGSKMRQTAPIKTTEENNRTILNVHSDFFFDHWPENQELKCSVARGKAIVATLRLKKPFPGKNFFPIRDAMIPTTSVETPFALVADLMYLPPEQKNTTGSNVPSHSISYPSSSLSTSSSIFSFFLSKRESSSSLSAADRHKILIVGASESGKSTLFKRLCSLPFSAENKKYYGDMIRKNVIQAVKVLVEAAKTRLYSTLPDNARSIAFIANLDEENFSPSAVLLHLSATLADPGIHKTLLDRSALQITDCCVEVFFPKIDEIFSENYSPSDSDILASRVKTTGIIESMTSEGWTVFDVGGSKMEQKKWVHLYEHVTCVIFTVNLAGYDCNFTEDSKSNCMAESMALWESVATHAAFTNTFFVLLFTYDNVFHQKIKQPVAKDAYLFPELVEARGSYAQASTAISSRFLSRLDSKRKRAFFVDLLDDQSYAAAIRAIRDFVVPQSLLSSSRSFLG